MNPAILERIKGAAATYHIDPLLLQAVALVESSGNGFSGGRMVIRFEVHKFYQFWGATNLDTFHTHFIYLKEQPWANHQVKLPGSPVFQAVHIGQWMEWKTFDFARSLNEDAAISSISMGMFQLMGFNHKLCGFDEARKMFDKLSEGEPEQFDAFIAFINSERQALQALQRFGTDPQAVFEFTTRFNGGGAAAKYTMKIEQAYRSLKGK